MPKEMRHGRGAKSGAAPVRVPVTERRMGSAEPDPRLAPSELPAAAPRRSAIMRLAGEVERLEHELAAARAQMAALEAKAEIDPLTDILNRRGFERALKRALAHVKRYGTSAALLYVDLDRFKLVNDRHGHAAGDAVLAAVAAVLVRHVRGSDVVARLGGDEFAVLLWQLTEADALRKALTLEAAIARTTATHSGATLSAGASIGIAPLLPLDRSAEVLERADRAMYQRKAARGREATASRR